MTDDIDNLNNKLKKQIHIIVMQRFTVSAFI